MKENFNIKLADIVFSIEPAYDYIKEYCRDYITDEKADLFLKTETADLIFERERSNKVPEHIEKMFSDEYLEVLSVYRKISEKLPFLDTLLFHGSAIAVDNIGYIFTAKSGTGKSTHTKLWREFLGERAIVVNDDKPLIKITNNGSIVYGTPWNGKHKLSTNISVPLKAICILTRSEQNFIEEISSKEAYQMILQQTYRPIDRSAVVKSLALIDLLMKNTKLYRLGCNMTLEAAKVAFEGMNGGII